ncbi:hypothetical protein Plhal710r2_c029g0109331 [Plasmopara halstedii]
MARSEHWSNSCGHRVRFPTSRLPGGSGIITNHLDEAKEQQLETAHRAALMRSYPRLVLDPRVEYGFRSASAATEAKDATSRSLCVYVIGPSTTTKAELDKHNALRAHFLVL